MPRAGSRKVNVPAGIPGLYRLLGALPKESQGEVRDAAQEIAGKVAIQARSVAQGQGGAMVYVAPTITAKRDRVPSIQSGGTAVLPGRRRRPNRESQRIGNVLWGAEFGSTRYRQFRPWTGNGQDAGYAIYPTFRRLGDDIREEYLDALQDAVIGAARRS